MRNVRVFAGQTFTVNLNLEQRTVEVTAINVTANQNAIVPRDHPLATRGTVSLSEFGSLPFIFARSTVDPGTFERGAAEMRKAGMKSPVLALEGDLRAVHLAVAAARGWTLMSRARALAPPEGTSVLTVEGFHLAVRMMVEWRRGERRSVVHTVLRRMFEVARTYPEAQVRAAPALPPAARSRMTSLERTAGSARAR